MFDRHAIAADLLRLSGLSATGRGVTDPIFNAINEGRYAATARARLKNPAMVSYSDCGDNASWLLFRLGVRFPWINRVEMNGKWRVGMNVACVTRRPYGENPIARAPRLDDRYVAGDVLVVAVKSGTTHVTCVIEYDPDTGRILTSDGGQPGHKLVENRLEKRGSELWRGARRVDSVLILDDVLDAAAAGGRLVAPETAEQWLQRLREHDTEPTMPAVQPTLRRGSLQRDAVEQWQSILRDSIPSVRVDGIFGAQTEAATKQWQASRGLVSDGVVGLKTWTAADREEDTQPETPGAKL